MPAIVFAQSSRSIVLSRASATPQTRLRDHLRFAIQRNIIVARADNASGVSAAQGTGIVFGVLGAVLLFVIWCFCCRDRKKKTSAHRSSPEPIRRPHPPARPQPLKKEKKEKKQKKTPAKRVRQVPAPAPAPPPPPPQAQRPTRPRPTRVRNSRNAPPQPEPEPQSPQLVPQPPPPPPPPPPPQPEPSGTSVAERIRRFIPMSGPIMDFSRPPTQQVYIGDRITRNAQASESRN